MVYNQGVRGLLSSVVVAGLAGGCQSPPERLAADGATGTPTPDGGDIDAAPGACSTSWPAESSTWAACMKRSVWEQLEMATISHQMTEDGPCYQCHRGGVGGIFLSEDGDETFDRTRELPFLGAHLAAEYGDDDCLVGVIASRRLLDKEDRTTPFHPDFEWSSERRQALVDFFDITHADYLAGSCGSLRGPVGAADSRTSQRGLE